MISLRKYLYGEISEGSPAVSRHILDLFLRGIAEHAVEGDKADLERFQKEIQRLAGSLKPRSPIDELLLIGSGALLAMEDYNGSTTKFVRRLAEEMQKMVAMLTRTVISIGASSETSVDKLQQIEKSIEGVRMLEDMRALKTQLEECLHSVREETLRQKADRQAAMECLQRELDRSRERVGSALSLPGLDSATGLPDRSEAQRAMEAAAQAPDGKFVLLAVAGRVQAVKARFGLVAGERMLAASARHFRKSLGSRDKLFRWEGPALLGVLEREGRIDHVYSEVRQFADMKLEEAVESGNRTVLIPFSCNWSVFQVEAPLETLLRKVDMFTAAQLLSNPA
jgi:GGDEF domain-containing protein